MLHFGVCTAASELLRVVGSHVRKVPEDVLVGLVTWIRTETAAWAQLMGSTSSALMCHSCVPGINLHSQLNTEHIHSCSQTQLPTPKSEKHANKWPSGEHSHALYLLFAAGGARCTSSPDQPDISAGRRQRAHKCTWQKTHSDLKNKAKHTSNTGQQSFTKQTKSFTHSVTQKPQF